MFIKELIVPQRAKRILPNICSTSNSSFRQISLLFWSHLGMSDTSTSFHKCSYLPSHSTSRISQVSCNAKYLQDLRLDWIFVTDVDLPFQNSSTLVAGNSIHFTQQRMIHSQLILTHGHVFATAKHWYLTIRARNWVKQCYGCNFHSTSVDRLLVLPHFGYPLTLIS